MRVLFVAMPDHSLAPFWTGFASRQGWDVHLFPVQEGLPHPGWHKLTVHSLSRWKNVGLDESVRVQPFWPFQRGAGTVSMVIGKLAPGLLDRARWLARIIRRVQPDVVHSLGAKSCRRLIFEARRHCRDAFPRWVVSLATGDCYLRTGRIDPEARPVLAACDAIIGEHEQQIPLVGGLGGKAWLGPPGCVADALTLLNAALRTQMCRVPKRNLVVVHADDAWPGEVSLRALADCADDLRGYRVILLSSCPRIAISAGNLANRLGISVEVVAPGDGKTILGILGQARIFFDLGGPNSDAILMLALANGAFPIALRSPVAEEFVSDAVTGRLIAGRSHRRAVEGLRQALRDDVLVDRAAQMNRVLCRGRMEESGIAATLASAYAAPAAVPGSLRPSESCAIV
ncbi:hypothetical protein AYO44_13590 [Planctomycetaceae bacterium SCGC AG-212-F19]|nr:hypothetical protein AYO44_13590 [Planctomycetaceae bacterium SCGC AG-212-F19]